MGTNEVLAFDWGTTIVGILDVERNVYTPHRFGEGMFEGAKRIATSVDTIVSFNGNGRDLIEIARILSIPSKLLLSLRCQHDDMADTISAIRWPPDPGTAPILDQSLNDPYRHYFAGPLPPPPAHVHDGYEVDNWADYSQSTKRAKIEKASFTLTCRRSHLDAIEEILEYFSVQSGNCR
jgi:hypothetical protein